MHGSWCHLAPTLREESQHRGDSFFMSCDPQSSFQLALLMAGVGLLLFHATPERKRSNLPYVTPHSSFFFPFFPTLCLF